MKKLTIALTGIGGYGSYYADFLLNNPYNKVFDFTGVIDPLFENSPYARQITDRSIPAFKNIDDFYKIKKADLMLISTPIHLHRPHSEIAVKNGSAVLCEKPAAATFSDVLYMKDLMEIYKKEIFIGFQLSFTNPILNLKRDLLTGKYGRIISAKTIVLWERGFNYYSRNNWAGKIKDENGTPVYDSVASNATAHYLHNLLFLLGDSIDKAATPADIDARCFKANDIESFDTCIARLTTIKGQRILFVASHAIKGNIEPKFQIQCEYATIIFDANDAMGLTAIMNDGHLINYGNPISFDEDRQKIVKTIDWLIGDSDERPACDVSTTIPFTRVINHIFESVKFERFEKNRIIHDEKNSRVYVSGLHKELSDYYESENPSELLI